MGVVIDGVYRPRNGVGFGDLGELERIEVLKGPQGTVFGKNTSAGVINVISKRPDFEGSASIELTGMNFGGYEAAASINGPLVDDKLAGRFYAASRRRDGLYDVSTGDGTRQSKEDADRDVVLARGQLLFTPSEGTERTVHRGLRAALRELLRRRADQRRPHRAAHGCGCDGLGRFASRGSLPPARSSRTARTGRRSATWAFPPSSTSTRRSRKITSITAWRNFESEIGQDADYSTGDVLWRNLDGPNANEFKQLSEELRFSGESDKFDWMVGAFYAKEDLDSDLNLRYGADFETYYSLVLSAGMAPMLVNALTGRPAQTAYPTGAGYQDRFEQRSDSFAVFTNDTFHFTERLHGTIGLRYTQEQKDLDSVYSNSDNGAGCAASRARYPIIAGALPAAAVAGWYNFGCATFADPIYNGMSTSQSIDESETSGTAKLAFDFNRAAHELRLLRAWLQGQRLQPGSRAHPDRFDGRALVRLRSGHELQARDRGFVRARREVRVIEPHVQVELFALLSEVRGLPAQHLHGHQLRGRVDSGSDLARRRPGLRPGADGRSRVQRRRHVRGDRIRRLHAAVRGAVPTAERADVVRAEVVRARSRPPTSTTSAARCSGASTSVRSTPRNTTPART